MGFTQEEKQQIFAKHGFGKAATDTGSAESQIALFTHRINYLTGHLQKNPKDHASRLGLLKLVGKRRSLLDYLHKKDINRYRAVLADLGIRK